MDKEVAEIEDRIERAILAFKIEEMLMLKEEEKEMQKFMQRRLLDLELFTYEPYEVTKQRYITDFSNFCDTETKIINTICSNFRIKNNLNT